MPFGRPALPEEIAAWDIDVRPDGMGLPVGTRHGECRARICSSSAAPPAMASSAKVPVAGPCSSGGQGTLTADRPEKTVGSFWPYGSTVYDYIRRAMPFGDAQSLTPDEIYAVSLYLLYANDVIEDPDKVYDQTSFAGIAMPNRDGFLLPDPRPDTPKGEPCMHDCPSPTAIVGRAAILDVTPDQEGAVMD